MTNIQLKAPSLPVPHEQVFAGWDRLSSWLQNNGFEILVAGGIATGLVVLLLALRSLATRFLGDEKTRGWRQVIRKAAGKTNFFFILMLSIKLVSAQAALPARIAGLINVLFVVATAFQMAIWARALVLGTIEQRVGEGQEHRTLGTAMGLIRGLVSVAVFVIATIVVLDNLGVNVTALIAGLGIGGIAIGFAAQGVFSDLFAALAIIFDRPFRRGDTITVGNGANAFTGTVENIGLKTTRFRALTGELVAYGNADLLKNPLHNNALITRRRVVMILGLTYETDPELLAKVPEEVKAIVEAQELTSFDHCIATAFAASSVDFEMVFHVNSTQFDMFAKARQGVMFAILKRFRELGLSFAYPTQTSYTAAPDGSIVLPYPKSESAPPPSPPLPPHAPNGA